MVQPEMSSEDNDGWVTVKYSQGKPAAPTGRNSASKRPSTAWKPIHEVPAVYEQPEEPEVEHYIEGQNWAPVRINKKRPTTTVSKGAVGAQRNPNQQRLRKLDAADAPQKQKRLTRDSIQRMKDARVVLQWNQNRLNTACEFPVNTIREIEAGRLTPTIQQLDTLNRVLKLSLTME
jgi:hypothetical protein